MKRPWMSGARAQRLRVSAIGLSGTATVHALLVLPLFLELSLPKDHAPNRSGAGASAVVSNREPVMTAVFINDPARTSQQLPTVDPEELASRGVAPKDLAVIVLSPDSSPAADADPASDESPAPAEAAGNEAEHALLYGRYLTQVQARIERAWVRPRSEIGAPRFSCRARIDQDSQGFVVRVSLEHCHGVERWRQSLVNAIRTASPLPAPPDPSVYADVLSLVFESDAFRPGAPGDGFEPANNPALVAAQAADSLTRFVEQIRNPTAHSSGAESDVIRLTIVGERRVDSPFPNQPPPDSGDTQEPAPQK